MKILFYYNSVYYPGIALLSSFLKQRGHITELLFDPAIGTNHYMDVPILNNIISKKKLVNKAIRFNPDLIAFSFVTNQFQDMQVMGRLLKNELSVPIIAGGTHPTIMPEQVINENWVDIVCIGEGEYAISELLENIENKKDYTKISNLWVKDSVGEIHKNKLRPLINDLDILPFPDYEMFARYGLINKRIDIITGRGCMNACTYCINSFKKQLYSGENILRRRSPENVIAELKELKNTFNPSSFRFLDDTFAYDVNWLKDFGRDYKHFINLPFRCTLNPNVTKPEIIAALKASGCESVTMGLQSASYRIRSDIMNRYHTNEKIIEISDSLKKNKIKLSVDLIYGTPTETPSEMSETLEFCSKLKLHSVTPSFFYPFPKTILTEKCIEEGYLTKELYARVVKGEGSYHTAFLLNHPYKDYVLKYQALTQIFIIVPGFLKKYFRWLLKRKYNIVHRFFHFISIPMNEFYEFRRRLFMIPKVLIKTRKEISR